jgi:hypothetical protein
MVKLSETELKRLVKGGETNTVLDGERRWRDTARDVRRCSWPFAPRLVKRVRVSLRSWLFTGGCRGSCQFSCQDVAPCHRFPAGKRALTDVHDLRWVADLEAFVQRHIRRVA